MSSSESTCGHMHARAQVWAQRFEIQKEMSLDEYQGTVERGSN
jgi:hypothetical protein